MWADWVTQTNRQQTAPRSNICQFTTADVILPNRANAGWRATGNYYEQPSFQAWTEHI